MAEIVDFGLQQHKIKMDSRYFENVLSVVAGDTGRRIEVQLLDTNGMVQDTTGLNLRLNAVIAGKATFTDATLVDAATGKYQLDLSNGMFLAPGNWQFQWQITDSAGKKLHSFAFAGNVGKNISEGGSQATNFYLNLEDLKAMQDDLVNGTFESVALETNIAEKLEALEETYAPRLTEVTAQLAQTNGRMDGIAINAAHPPIPFRKITSDANYYDSANFKYYKDEQMTIPATDNTGVVQALVNFLHEKGGGTLLIPDGEYVFRSTIAWKSRVSLIGASKTGTRLYSEGVQFSLIKGTDGNSDGSSGNDPSVWFDDCKFTDFLIDNKGLSFSEKTVDGKALFILYMRRAVFRDLILLNTLGTALGCDFLVDTVIDTVFTDRAGRSSYPTGHGGNSGIGIGTSALSDEPLVVTNCFTYNSGNYGVFVETQRNPSGVKAKYAKIVNCHSQGNRLGFGNKGSGGTQFIGCTAVLNRSHGFHLTQGVSGDQLLGCVSEKNGGDGVRIEKDYVGDLDISNVWANENIGAGIRALKNDAILKNIRILDSKTHRNGTSGVWIGGNTKNVDIKGINSVNNGQDTSVAADFRRGILVEGVNDIVSILDNTVFDDQAVKTQIGGIHISTTTTNYVLDGNNVRGYAPNAAYIADLTKGKIGTNSDLSFEKHGLATIAEGQLSVDVVHGMGKIPTAINISAVQYTGIPVPIWIVKSDGNMIRVRKELATGTVDFYWDVKTD